MVFSKDILDAIVKGTLNMLIANAKNPSKKKIIK